MLAGTSTGAASGTTCDTSIAPDSTADDDSSPSTADDDSSPSTADDGDDDYAADGSPRADLQLSPDLRVMEMERQANWQGSKCVCACIHSLIHRQPPPPIHHAVHTQIRTSLSPCVGHACGASSRVPFACPAIQSAYQHNNICSPIYLPVSVAFETLFERQQQHLQALWREAFSAHPGGCGDTSEDPTEPASAQYLQRLAGLLESEALWLDPKLPASPLYVLDKQTKALEDLLRNRP